MDIQEQVIQTLDLLSNKNFGLGTIDLTDEWAEEEKDRENECENLKFKTHRTKQLKSVVRNGLSNSSRRRYWFILSGGYDLYIKVGNVYQQAVEATKDLPINEKSLFGISFNFLIYNHPSIAQILPAFLNALWYNNQDVEYSPLIPVFASMLLMYMEPPLAYLTLQSIINKSRESSFFLLLSKDQLFTAVESVEKLIIMRQPNIANHAEKLGIHLSQLILSIFPSFFIPFISISVSLTVFDAFVSEGRKVLFRFLLQILNDEKNNLLNTNNPNEFGRIIFNAIDRLNNPSKLKSFTKKAYKLKLKRKDHIEKLEKEANGIPESLKLQLNEQMDGTFSMIPQESSNNSFIPFVRHKRASALQMDSTMSLIDSGSHMIEVLKKRISSSNLINRCEMETMKSIQAQIALRCLPAIFSHGEKNLILNEQMLLSLRNKLPSVFRLYSADLAFKMTINGKSFQTLFQKCTCRCQYIMIIKTDDDKVIGAFLSDPPLPENVGYYGTQMTTVFDMDKKLFFKLKIPVNKCFMSVSDDEIMIGGPQPAICVKKDFGSVYSQPCDTFKSPILTSDQNGNKIVDFEMYRFLPHHYFRQRRNSITSLQKNKIPHP